MRGAIRTPDLIGWLSARTPYAAGRPSASLNLGGSPGAELRAESGRGPLQLRGRGEATGALAEAGRSSGEYPERSEPAARVSLRLPGPTYELRRRERHARCVTSPPRGFGERAGGPVRAPGRVDVKQTGPAWVPLGFCRIYGVRPARPRLLPPAAHGSSNWVSPVIV